MPVKKAIVIETKNYKGDWEPFKLPFLITKADDDPRVRGIVIKGLVYLATQIHNEIGAVGYLLQPPTPVCDLPDLSRDPEVVTLGELS